MKITSLLLATLFFSYSLFAETIAQKGNERITVMSLNIYGWKTMPKHSDDYAQLINHHKVDVLGIQEGVEDWQLKADDLINKLPTNYQRAITLHKSLGECWQHKFQIFINHCQGNRFIKTGRFELTDGPNATRTGEYAVVENSNHQYFFVNVHWEHESADARMANARETATQLNKTTSQPTILLGDFNSQCDGKEARLLQALTKVSLVKSAGIDCLFVKGVKGEGSVIDASPSDHPAIVATLKPESKKI